MELFSLKLKIGGRSILAFVLLLFVHNSYGQQLLDDKRVLFYGDTRVMLDLSKEDSPRRFTPIINEVDSADAVLAIYLRSVIKKSGGNVDLDTYYRQYVGLWLNGRRYIYVNATCRKPDYFLKDTDYPKGGGPCYFRTLVDPISKRVDRFNFNAPK